MMIKEFIRDFKEWFGNEHIYTRRRRIKALSPLWWIVRTLQAAAVMGVLYIWYCLMWFVLA